MFGKKDSKQSPNKTNGPVVKTGPTSGQNRSRNQDGQWRAKRSDSGTEKKKSGCFLTTAACEYMGLPDDCRQLQMLRIFRDTYMAATPDRAAMVSHYYEIAPRLASLLTQSDLEFVWTSIERCVEDIDAGRPSAAVATYTAMTQAISRAHCHEKI